MGQDIQVIQLSKNNLAVTFNKQALEGLKHGKSQAIKLKQGLGRKDITFLFMRDVEFAKRQQQFFSGGMQKKSFWSRLWPFGKKAGVTVRETKNKKYRYVKR